MWWTVNKYDEWNFSDDNIPFPIHKVTYRHISKSRTLAKKISYTSWATTVQCNSKIDGVLYFHTVCMVLCNNEFFRYSD